MNHRALQIRGIESGFAIQFQAMGSPCEVLVESADEVVATSIAELVADEAWRIEAKFSRYVDDNVVARINTAAGASIKVDAEAARLLDFGRIMHDLSGGAFDVTSGALRSVWTFDGSDKLPSQASVERVLHRVGWPKVYWNGTTIRLEPGMEIDLGGLGKEYAVDRSIGLLQGVSDVPCLVNFGGDLAVNRAPRHRDVWNVGIEGQGEERSDTIIALKQGALASSGDARRFVCKDGVRYGHILDPRTGWPVVGAAKSVTVAADTCTQAGMLSTLALLKGADAELFLREQAEESWCQR